MPRKPLLLPSAKAGILVPSTEPASSAWWRIAALSVGVLVIGVGAADALTRASDRFLGPDAARLAFAPVVAFRDPSVLNTLFATSSVTAAIPARLHVPSIGVDALVEQVTQKSNGAMATPANLVDVGWYKLGSKPGESGNAVFAGHVNNAAGLPGVFTHLADLQIGSSIEVLDASGKKLKYLVTEIGEYPLAEAPAARIFATTGPSQIVLITCDGVWSGKSHTYDKRLVVLGKLLP